MPLCAGNMLADCCKEMDRDRLDEEVFIEFNGPLLFEMDNFTSRCVSKFLALFKPPMTQKSKYEISKVIAKMSFLRWS